MITVNYVDL
jgi:hypothetical protein